MAGNKVGASKNSRTKRGGSAKLQKDGRDVTPVLYINTDGASSMVVMYVDSKSIAFDETENPILWSKFSSQMKNSSDNLIL